MRRMREIESTLGTLELSPDLKVAAYDWALACPEANSLVIY